MERRTCICVLPCNWFRYRDVYPYDHSRVGVEGVPSTDYVNASLVKVEAVARSYILTQVQLTLTHTGHSGCILDYIEQGPLAATTSHFWCLTWEQQSKAVIMLNRVMEKGTLKCHQVGQALLLSNLYLIVQ